MINRLDGGKEKTPQPRKPGSFVAPEDAGRDGTIGGDSAALADFVIVAFSGLSFARSEVFWDRPRSSEDSLIVTVQPRKVLRRDFLKALQLPPQCSGRYACCDRVRFPVP